MAKRARVADMEVWKDLGTATEDTGVHAYKEARLIDIAFIHGDPNQPRRTMDETALRELAESIRALGVLQPIVVRPDGDRFRIIAGHRRYEACKLIGLAQMPAIVREASEHEAVEQALIENVQREDINPIEEAQCYRRLMDEHKYSIREMAAKVHKSVGYIHGRLELLRYPDVAESVGQAALGVFEARELAKVENETERRALAQRIAAGEVNRETLKQEVKALTGKATTPPPPPTMDAETLLRRWQRLQYDLKLLQESELPPGEWAKVEEVLQEIVATVSRLLARLE